MHILETCIFDIFYIKNSELVICTSQVEHSYYMECQTDSVKHNFKRGTQITFRISSIANGEVKFKDKIKHIFWK